MSQCSMGFLATSITPELVFDVASLAPLTGEAESVDLQVQPPVWIEDAAFSNVNEVAL